MLFVILFLLILAYLILGTVSYFLNILSYFKETEIEKPKKRKLY